MTETKKLTGKVALVSAAGRGIGRGVAENLAAAGAHVVVNSYSQDTTQATVHAITAAGGEASAHVGDITDPDVILAMRDFAISAYGQIDILVNNVGAGPKTGMNPSKHELGLPAAIWDGMYAQNLKSCVLMTEAVVPHMKEQRSGKLIFMTSIAGRHSLSDQMLSAFVHPAYGAMKAALVSYTQTQAEMLGPHNINVNAVAPGIVYTDAWEGQSQRAVQTMPEFEGMEPREWFEGIARGDYPKIFDRTPLRREQTVEDIAAAVRFLVSDDAMNITGQCLMVDGGMVKI